eukprot:5060550-Pleurochrysis_carterae.AAC.2
MQPTQCVPVERLSLSGSPSSWYRADRGNLNCLLKPAIALHSTCSITTRPTYVALVGALAPALYSLLREGRRPVRRSGVDSVSDLSTAGRLRSAA